MNQRTLIGTFCKAFGLYFAIQVLLNIKDTLFFGVMNNLYDSRPADFYYFIGAQFFNVLFNGVAAWTLIAKSDFLSSKLTRDTSDELKIDLKTKDAIELVIIGISGLIIIESIPEIFTKLANYIYFNPFDKVERNDFWTSEKISAIYY